MTEFHKAYIIWGSIIGMFDLLKRNAIRWPIFFKNPENRQIAMNFCIGGFGHVKH